MRVDIFRTVLVKEKGINYGEQRIENTDDVCKMMCHLFQMNSLPEEHCYIICLNAKARVTGIHLLSIGDISSSIVHPRSVFQRAILNNAYGIILCHNHPSGDPTPSREDIETSIRLDKAGELLGIRFMDSIIIGDNSHLSLMAEGLL